MPRRRLRLSREEHLAEAGGNASAGSAASALRRHQALVPLSHDHHHGLAQARRLRRAGDEADPERLLRVASSFVDFFAREGAGHFRDEEEHLFPLLADCGDNATSLLAEIAVQHAAVRSLVGQLRRSIRAGRIEAEVLLGSSCSNSIRLEERQLFPLSRRSSPTRTSKAFHSPRTRSPSTRAARSST